MTGFLRITSVQKSSGRPGSGKKSSRKDLLVTLSHGGAEPTRGRWIHLQSLQSFRLGRPFFSGGTQLFPVRGLSRRNLKAGDGILPADCPQICSRVFFGTVENLQLPYSCDLSFDKQTLPARFLHADGDGPASVRLELLQPAALFPGKPLIVGGGRFTPLTVFPWNDAEFENDPFLLQGWMPLKAVTAPAAVPVAAEGGFLFLESYLERVRKLLLPATRGEGGLDRRKISPLINIPPYVADDVISILQSRNWFSLQEGKILDSNWDYSRSLSPMNRGLLKQMEEEGYLIEKIIDSPRGRGLSILCGSGLAVEIEEGVFMQTALIEKISSSVDELRMSNPDISLGELARVTGIKKRYLIALLQYRDTVL